LISAKVFRGIGRIDFKNSEGEDIKVEGHADNIGKITYNMKLSRSRAEAVVKNLVTKYAIPSDRLKPYGIGPLAPMASNKTKAGCALNRRVELVQE